MSCDYEQNCDTANGVEADLALMLIGFHSLSLIAPGRKNLDLSDEPLDRAPASGGFFFWS